MLAARNILSDIMLGHSYCLQRTRCTAASPSRTLCSALPLTRPTRRCRRPRWVLCCEGKAGWGCAGRAALPRCRLSGRPNSPSFAHAAWQPTILTVPPFDNPLLPHGLLATTAQHAPPPTPTWPAPPYRSGNKLHSRCCCPSPPCRARAACTWRGRGAAMGSTRTASRAQWMW